MRETYTAMAGFTAAHAPVNQATSIMTTGSTAQYDRMVKPGENILSRKRKEGDFELTQAVRQILVEAGQLRQVEEHFDTHHMIGYSVDLDPGAQLFLQNAYWRLQLMNLPVDTADTIHERLYLQDNVEVEVWLEHFKKVVVPKLVELNLPASLGEVRNQVTVEQLRVM
jgi:hypothetical protein